MVDLLTQLVDKSLLDVDPAAGGVRYRLLETIRQYAQERLEDSAEMATLRGRHLTHYMALAEKAGPHLRTRDQLAWASALAPETDNFRAALDWAVQATRPDEGLRLVIPLMATGVPTGWLSTDWAETARSIPGASTNELFPLAVAYAAMAEVFRGDLDRAAELVATAREAQSALGTTHTWVHAAAGVLAFFQNDMKRARQHAEAWLELARARHDPFELAHALILVTSALLDDPAQAEPVAEQALRAARDVGAAGTLLYALLAHSLALTEQHPERALKSLQEAADVAASLGDRAGAASAMTNQGAIALRRRDWPAALRAYAAGVEQHLQLGQPLLVELLGLATAFAGMGCYEPAAVIFGRAHAMFAGGPPSAIAPDDLVNSAEDAVAAAFDADRLAELEARGAAMDLASAVIYLRSEVDRILADGKDIAGVPA